MGLIEPSIAKGYGLQELGFFDPRTKMRIGESLIRSGAEVVDSPRYRPSAVWNEDETRVAINTGMRTGSWTRVFQRTKSGFVELAMPDYDAILPASSLALCTARGAG